MFTALDNLYNRSLRALYIPLCALLINTGCSQWQLYEMTPLRIAFAPEIRLLEEFPLFDRTLSQYLASQPDIIIYNIDIVKTPYRGGALNTQVAQQLQVTVHYAQTHTARDYLTVESVYTVDESVPYGNESLYEHSVRRLLESAMQQLSNDRRLSQ